MMNALMGEYGGSDESFELNADLDAKALATRYRERRRVRIPDFLEHTGALKLHQHLANEVLWTTFLIAENTVYSVPSNPDGSYPPGVEHDILARARNGARESFACVYEANRLFPEDFPDGSNLESVPHTPLLTSFSAFLNSPPFLELCRTVTGIGSIARADIQATRHRSGHFTTFHTALPYSYRHGRRVAAFEVNLTIDWKPEYGGSYGFKCTGDYITEAYVPSFNLLDIFSTGKGRWISSVTPLAEGERLAVCGWLYGNDSKE